MILKDGWNFHNNIAIPLENIAKKEMQYKDSPINKIFNADSIESGHFIETMIILLRHKTDFSNENNNIDKFIEENAIFLNKKASEFDNETAESIFTIFKNMF